MSTIYLMNWFTVSNFNYRRKHFITYLRLPPVKSPLGWKISPSKVTLGVLISLLKAT